MDTINASKLVEEDYERYGRYVNTTRAVTNIDGLKTVERRMLLAIRDVASGKGWVPSGAIVGRNLAYHAHGEAYNTLVKLARENLIDFLGDYIEPAAMRYTSARASAKFSESVFKFLKYVPTQITQELEEPTYLTVPVPICFFTGCLGIGVGVQNSIPRFDLRSIIKARKTDNPAHLKAPDGLTILSSDVDKIWKRGLGWVQYGMRCYQDWQELDGKMSSVIEGSSCIFTPQVDKAFFELQEQGLLTVRDESSDNYRKVISKVKGIRKITDDTVYEICKALSQKTCYYRLYVSMKDPETDKNIAVRISMRDWLNLTWDKFKKVVELWKQDSIENINTQIEIFDLVSKVRPKLMKNLSNAEIAEVLKKDIKIINKVTAKPLGLIRKTDFDSEIVVLEKKLKKVQSTTANNILNNFVSSIYNRGEDDE